MKVVINTCFGGYSLSARAIDRIARRKGFNAYFFNHAGERINLTTAEQTHFFLAARVPKRIKKPSDQEWAVMTPAEHEEYFKTARDEFIDFSNRTDPDVIAVIEALGTKKASGSCAHLQVVEIPDEIQYTIDEYDGFESIHEVHRSWP